MSNDDTADKIESNALTGFRSMSGDEGSVQNNSISDQIAAAKYAARRRASKAGNRSVLRSIMGPTVSPPSARGH